MCAKTTRAKSTGLENRLDFELTVDRVSYLDLEIADLANERDRAVQEAQKLHAELIAELEAEQKAKLALCEKFAEEHRADLLAGPAKSAETPLSTWGFRTGMPQLKLLSKWTWDKVLETLQSWGGKDNDFIRVRLEVNKEAILRCQADGYIGRQDTPLAELGLKVVQTESFYIEPKVDTAEPVKA